MILFAKAQIIGGIVTKLIAFGIFDSASGYFALTGIDGWDVRLEKQEFTGTEVMSGLGAWFQNLWD